MTRKTYGAVDLAGLTGAVQATRWVGGTTSGPPTTGTFAIGDYVVARNGAVWICTAAGSPGTWIVATGGTLTGTFAQFGGVAADASNKGMLYFITDLEVLARSNGSGWVIAGGSALLDGVGPGSAIKRSLVDAKGDLLVGTAADTVARLAVGTPGQYLIPDSTLAGGLDWATITNVPSVRLGTISGETVSRASPMAATLPAGISGQLRLVGIWLSVDRVITSVRWAIGSTALSGGTNGWTALYDSSLNLLRQSTNTTSPAAAASTVIQFDLSSTFTTTYSGVHFLGVMWTHSAGAMPTLLGVNGSAVLNADVFINSGTSTGSLTTTAPNPAAAITALAGIPFAYVF